MNKKQAKMTINPKTAYEKLRQRNMYLPTIPTKLKSYYTKLYAGLVKGITIDQMAALPFNSRAELGLTAVDLWVDMSLKMGPGQLEKVLGFSYDGDDTSTLPDKEWLAAWGYYYVPSAETIEIYKKYAQKTPDQYQMEEEEDLSISDEGNDEIKEVVEIDDEDLKKAKTKSFFYGFVKKSVKPIIAQYNAHVSIINNHPDESLMLSAEDYKPIKNNDGQIDWKTIQ